jgi:hypothetical protein
LVTPRERDLENSQKTVRRFVGPTRRAGSSTPVSASIATRRNQTGVKTASDLESGRSRTVALLVQPERDDRDMYAEFLEHEGLVALCVSDAIHALAIAPHADIVITGRRAPETGCADEEHPGRGVDGMRLGYRTRARPAGRM